LLGVLNPVQGLTRADLTAIADLERRVVDHDGGRLKLEWGVLESRSGKQVDDLLWRVDDRVVGFLGFYSFGPADLEFAGMVDPALRRTGIGSALLDAALPLAKERGFTRTLLVTPRSTPSGAAFALAKHAVLEHSEHFLSLGATPSVDPIDPTLTVRPATADDRGDVARILAAGFNEEEQPDLVIANTPEEQTLVIERAGAVLGTVRVIRHEATAGIYGFAVDPAYQGQGIGRDVLYRLSRQLREPGATDVTLEVAVDNERALDLYLSVGFEPQTTEDYYELALTD
jgi:ribosomal protein S18 acetylase RimI-like enzyme